MSLAFTKIPDDVFEHIQLNAGILVTDFDPATKQIGDIVGATSGGANFTDTPSYVDWGDDIDNCPKNTMELKKIESREVKLSGTFVSLTASLAKNLMATADIDSNDSTHIVPRDEVLTTDFQTLWWVGDYGNDGGFIAIKMMNALSTGGFQIQSGDKAKGQFSFEFTGHYSIEAQETVPYEVYIDNEATGTPEVVLNKHSVTIANGSTSTLTARTVPATATVTWSSSDSTKASVSGGVITGEAVGNAIITASITVDGVSYTDTCTVKVVAAA